jgi:Holliday junction resolvase RusA-like endonuclease
MVIPYTPIPKGRPRVTRWGTYTPPRTVEYAKKVADIARKTYDKPISCPCKMTFLFVMPIPTTLSKKKQEELIGKPHTKKTGDIDNLIKGCTDPMNGIVFDDDSLIYSIRAAKIYGIEPKTIIDIQTD